MSVKELARRSRVVLIATLGCVLVTACGDRNSVGEDVAAESAGGSGAVVTAFAEAQTPRLSTGGEAAARDREFVDAAYRHMNFMQGMANSGLTSKVGALQRVAQQVANVYDKAAAELSMANDRALVRPEGLRYDLSSDNHFTWTMRSATPEEVLKIMKASSAVPLFEAYLKDAAHNQAMREYASFTLPSLKANGDLLASATLE